MKSLLPQVQIILLIALCFPIDKVQAQVNEFTWQPIPLSRLHSVATMDDGFIWAVSSPEYGTGPVTIQKRNWEGEIIWEYSTQIPGFNLAVVTHLLELPDQGVLVFINDFECDTNGASILIRLDAQGHIQSGKEYGFQESGYFKNAISTQLDSAFPVIAWKGSVTQYLTPSGPFYLTRIDSIGAPFTKLPLPPAANSGAIFRDPFGKIRICLESGGLATLDPKTGSLSDTIFTDLGIIRNVIFRTDSTWLHLGSEKASLTNLNGNVVQEVELPGVICQEGIYVNGSYILLVWNTMTWKLEILVLNENIDLISALDTFSDDTQIIELIGASEGVWVVGHEHQNAFAKRIELNGEWAPLTSDASLVGLNYASAVRDSLDSGSFCHLWNQLTDVQIGVRNKGLDTLRQIMLSWSSVMQPSYYVWCDYGWNHLSFDDLAIAPGDTGWLFISQLDLYAKFWCDTPIQELEFCMEVSSPNGKIDAHHIGDTLCTSFPWITTSLMEEEAPEWNVFMPNPFRDGIQWSALPAGLDRIRIYGPLGELVADFSGLDSAATNEIPPGPAGLYLLVGQDEKGRVIGWQKLVRSQ